MTFDRWSGPPLLLRRKQASRLPSASPRRSTGLRSRTHRSSRRADDSCYCTSYQQCMTTPSDNGGYCFESPLLPRDASQCVRRGRADKGGNPAISPLRTIGRQLGADALGANQLPQLATEERWPILCLETIKNRKGVLMRALVRCVLPPVVLILGVAANVAWISLLGYGLVTLVFGI
jgi:hypothetical protein